MRVLLALIYTLFGFWSVLAPHVAQAHGQAESAHTETDDAVLDSVFLYDQVTVLLAASIIIAIVVALILVRKPESHVAKKISFLLIVVPALFATLYVATYTLNEIRRSPTGGPVHWHADFRIFNCGEEIDLLDPTGFSNRIGTPEVHVHGDSRFHIEGTLSSFDEATLPHFFEVVGGEFTSGTLQVPTNDGLVALQDGNRCPDEKSAELQVFLWSTDNDAKPWVAAQRKLTDGEFLTYVMTPEATVPPGDCFIIEFGPVKDSTSHICEQYAVTESIGDIEIVEPFEFNSEKDIQ